MKSRDYLLWEKIIIILVMGLILVQGGFFEDSYLLIGGAVALLMLNDNQIFMGNAKITLGISVVSVFCIFYHLLLEKAFLSGYILCFLVIYFLAVERNDLLKVGVFNGIIVMDTIGILAYCGIDIGGIIRNNRFMGTFQYANTTAIILVFAIIYLRESNDEIYCRWQLLNYIFLFLTFSIGGIISYILAVFYCLIDNKNTAKLWLKEILTVLLSALITAIIYFVSFIVKVNVLNIAIFVITIILSWNLDKILNRFIEKMKYVKIILTTVSIICVGAMAISVRIIAVNRAVKTFEERIWQMQDGLSVLRAHLLMGVGSHGWKNNLFKWRTHDYEVNIIHNSYLHISLKYGIIMLLLLLLMTTYLVYCSRKWERSRRAILYVGILHAFFDIDFFFMGYCNFIILDITETLQIGGKVKCELKNSMLYKNIFFGITCGILISKWIFIVMKKSR